MRDDDVRAPGERGAALLVALMAMLLISTAAATIVLTTSSESGIAANFRDSFRVVYAADAAVEWMLVDLMTAVDWIAVANGAVQSAFVDGPPSGARAVGGGWFVDLDASVRENAGRHLYAYGRLDALTAGSAGGPCYVLVFVWGDPLNAARLRLRAEAFGPRGARKVVDADVERGAGTAARLEAWREVR